MTKYPGREILFESNFGRYKLPLTSTIIMSSPDYRPPPIKFSAIISPANDKNPWVDNTGRTDDRLFGLTSSLNYSKTQILIMDQATYETFHEHFETNLIVIGSKGGAMAHYETLRPSSQRTESERGKLVLLIHNIPQKPITAETFEAALMKARQIQADTDKEIFVIGDELLEKVGPGCEKIYVGQMCLAAENN